LKDNENNKIQLFDNDNKLVDTYALYDADHKLVRIGIEKFEVEHDDVPTLDSVIKDKLHPRLKSITDKLNAPYRGREEEMIKIEVEAMACSTMVIDRAGYFEENIKIHDRKILAVEMESYGIARACKFANGGKTKWVIMKAVMDNMTQKSDGYKSKAAYTSANFLKIILEEDYL
jgi:hypothetical protein